MLQAPGELGVIRPFSCRSGLTSGSRAPAQERSILPPTPGRRIALRASATALAAWPLAGCSWSGALASLTPGGAHEHTDLVYGEDPRQRLDVYVPEGPSPKGGWPVCLFFYGGSWNRGDRATYRFVGRALASRGLVAVLPDYRVYPQVRYPEVLRDNAAATAWVRRGIAKHGGDAERIVVAGHSAGAYNAAMLAFDARWLGEVGLAPSVFRGFAGLAGPYDFLPIANPDVKPVFFHPDYPSGSQPIDHLRGFSRPVLVGAPASDSLVDPERNSAQLARRLREAGAPVIHRRYGRANHITLVAAFAAPLRWIAPVLDDVADFARDPSRAVASASG